ncbi:MAG: sialate O-acetylesterase [Planctomycetaceae bacterium]|nr:sialate O-acetylesterase [Planctomycetaceae bacterium]
MKRLRCSSLLGIIVTLCVVAIVAPPARGQEAAAVATKLTAATPFTDHMVLQRDTQARVWGWAEPGAEVEVKFADKAATCMADDAGRWEAAIGPFEASAEPRTLTVTTGDESLAFDDVLVGEVWIASGQSNMEWPVALTNDAEQEIAAAKWPEIRLFDVPHRVSEEPQTTVDTQGWKACTPETVKNFSAVAYFFGRKLHDELDVPIGLMSVNWGGTMMEAWTSREALHEADAFTAMIDNLRPLDEMPEDQRGTPHRAGVLFNAMLAPMIPYDIRGAIWYQGESNAGRHQQYRELSEVMIADWRARWNEGEFPFLLVQLAAWEPGGDNWPYLRESQAQCCELPNVGMAVTTDIGHRTDIHPRNKQEVGRRLALIALSMAYGQDVVHSGPKYRDMQIDGSEVTLRFDHAAGLKHDGDELAGFELAGTDGKFRPASAEIADGKVILSSDEVTEPAAVRYNWASFPAGTLRNEAGLPAEPFRTDSW